MSCFISCVRSSTHWTTRRVNIWKFKREMMSSAVNQNIVQKFAYRLPLLYFTRFRCWCMFATLSFPFTHRIPLITRRGFFVCPSIVPSHIMHL
jgi:hypothetical protein